MLQFGTGVINPQSLPVNAWKPFWYDNWVRRTTNILERHWVAVIGRREQMRHGYSLLTTCVISVLLFGSGSMVGAITAQSAPVAALTQIATLSDPAPRCTER